MQQCCLRKEPLTKIYETAYFVRVAEPLLYFFLGYSLLICPKLTGSPLYSWTSVKKPSIFTFHPRKNSKYSTIHCSKGCFPDNNSRMVHNTSNLAPSNSYFESLFSICSRTRKSTFGLQQHLKVIVLLEFESYYVSLALSVF